MGQVGVSVDTKTRTLTRSQSVVPNRPLALAFVWLTTLDKALFSITLRSLSKPAHLAVRRLACDVLKLVQGPIRLT